MLLRALSLVVAGLALGFAFNAARPHGVSLTNTHMAAACTAGEGPAELAPKDAAALCGAPGVVVADVRPPALFAQGHIAGAIHLPCKNAVPVDVARVEKASTVVVYGSSTDDARPVAATLAQRTPGARVVVVAGGFQAWFDAGLACASGPCDDCKVQR